MLSIKFIFVGKMREKHYISAFEEYRKRLGAYCTLETEEIPECRLSEKPTEKEIELALSREGREILRRVPENAALIALCVEGGEVSSEAFARKLSDYAVHGRSRLCFVVGGSFGLDGAVKSRADWRLSLSKMTFPHHLARVMLSEQLYRAFTINQGGKYHK